MRKLLLKIINLGSRFYIKSKYREKYNYLRNYSLFSSYSFAQKAIQSRVVKKMEVTQKDSDTIIDLKPLPLRRMKFIT
jgi:hypothetical protein